MAELLADYEKPEDLLGKKGLLDCLKKSLMEPALGVVDHFLKTPPKPHKPINPKPKKPKKHGMSFIQRELDRIQEGLGAPEDSA